MTGIIYERDKVSPIIHRRETQTQSRALEVRAGQAPNGLSLLLPDLGKSHAFNLNDSVCACVCSHTWLKVQARGQP